MYLLIRGMRGMMCNSVRCSLNVSYQPSAPRLNISLRTWNSCICSRMDGWALSQTWIVFKRFNYMNELKKWIHAYYLDSTWVFRQLKSNVDEMCLREASGFGSVTDVWLIFDFCLHQTNNLAKIVSAFIFSAYQLQLPNQFHSI